LSFIRMLGTGTIFGILFGFINYKMWKSNDEYAERISPPSLEAGEHIICESPASHYTLLNGFQGKLFLTDRRLIFIPREIFRPNGELTLNRAEIAGAGKRNPIDILNVKFIVVTASGRKEKFTVSDRREWFTALNM